MNACSEVVRATLFFYRDREVLFPSRKALALFRYLLVERRVSREKAAGLLWSERNEEAAHKNLRNALYREPYRCHL